VPPVIIVFFFCRTVHVLSYNFCTRSIFIFFILFPSTGRQSFTLVSLVIM
jgi:hypothetical protein